MGQLPFRLHRDPACAHPVRTLYPVSSSQTPLLRRLYLGFILLWTRNQEEEQVFEESDVSIDSPLG